MPRSLIDYYQEIGRAGRDGLDSYAVLLHGREDEDIIKSFIKGAQSTPNKLAEIADAARYGASANDILRAVNMSKTDLWKAIKYMMVHEYIYKRPNDGGYFVNLSNRFNINTEFDRQKQITESRVHELETLLDFVGTNRCYMRLIAQELNAPDCDTDCGICQNCAGRRGLPYDADKDNLDRAKSFLNNYESSIIEARKVWSNGMRIRSNEAMESGWVLSDDYYSHIGQLVSIGKYKYGKFGSSIINMSVNALRRKVSHYNIDMVVPIPSLRRPRLVPDFALSLANGLGLSYSEAIIKREYGVEQKSLLNSVLQEQNARNTLILSNKSNNLSGSRILLVDDMVDSRWTLTVAASLLREAGARCVYPLAIANTGGWSK